MRSPFLKERRDRGLALLKGWFNSDEPRDSNGQWTEGGGSDSAPQSQADRILATKIPKREPGQSNRDWWRGMSTDQRKRVAIRILTRR